MTLAEQIMAQARSTATKPCKKSTQGAGFKEKKSSPNPQIHSRDAFNEEPEPQPKMAAKSFQEDEDLNLSDLEEDQRRELLELEMQIENENLTRGERRRL